MASPVASSLPAIFFTDDEEAAKRRFPTIFMYAIAGAGKTNAIRTLKDYNPFVAATEDGQTKGMGTLGDLHFAACPINTLDELVLVTAELQSRAKVGELYYQTHGPFGALICDSLTGVGPMLERASMKLRGWDMIWDATKGNGKDPRQAYSYIAERGRQVVRKMMDLPVPLILTAREQIITEGEGASAKSYPAPELPGGKLPRELPGWPEATVRLRMLNGERVMQTENEGDIVARVRLKEGLRLPKFVKPDLGALIRLLQGDESALPLLIRDVDRAKFITVPQPQLPTASVPKTPQQLAAEARSKGA